MNGLMLWIPRRAPGISSRQRPSAEPLSVRPQQGYSQSAVHRPMSPEKRQIVDFTRFTHPPSNRRAGISGSFIMAEGRNAQETGLGAPRLRSCDRSHFFFFPFHCIPPYAPIAGHCHEIRVRKAKGWILLSSGSLLDSCHILGYPYKALRVYISIFLDRSDSRSFKQVSPF